MAGHWFRPWGFILSAALAVAVVGAVVGFRLAVGVLKSKVVEALGPGSEISDIQVGWTGVTVTGLRIKGPQRWPAPDALRADQVVIVPSLRGLVSGEVRLWSIRVVKPYLSAFRSRDGKLRVVPTLLERPQAQRGGGGSAGAPPVYIRSITLEDGAVELFDATVAQPPLRVRLEQLHASVHNVLVPALTGQSEFALDGVLKGIRQDGRVRIGGCVEVATKDSKVKMELRGVDLVALQPYLGSVSEARVQRGALDLDLHSEVRHNRLRAPGTATLADLAFAPAGALQDTFLGVPRSVVLAYMKGRNDKIILHFTLEGDINNPQFSLNEAFATRMASALADGLGVSVRGLAEGVGVLGRKGAEVVGEATKGIGGAIQGLFGGARKK